MYHKTFSKTAISILMSAFLLSSCLDNQYEDIKDSLSSGFDFSTVNQVKVSITTLDNSNELIKGAQIRLYSGNPLNEDGSLKSNHEDLLLFTGSTDAEGKLNCQVSPATSVDSLTVLVNQIGLPAIHKVKIQPEISLTIGGAKQSLVGKQNTQASRVIGLPTPTKINGFYVLGTWTYGVPDYLYKPGDILSAGLLADVNATLPEYSKLPQKHPEFFDDPSDGSVKLYEDAEVFVTFVHEGAAWTNTLAYYTYPTNTPPSLTTDINNLTVIFPNFSFSGSGGGLNTGDKVQLLYLDPVTKTYSKIFPKGTTVAWGLHAQGYSNSTVKAVNNQWMWYSDQKLNQEIDVLKKHNVVLRDAERNLLLIGFEDQQRSNSDNDFNDAVYYATTNPVTAINPSDYEKVIKVKDTDNDGVSDENDEYPEDANKAYNNYYPGKDKTATLAFEDLWPSRGDYDFNDLVIDYHYNTITNGKNEVVKVDADFTLRAIGGSYQNGFGVQFNTTPENIKSVTGQKFTDDKLSIAANGSENKQNQAVIMIFDNASKLLEHKGYQIGVNTVSGTEFVEPVQLKVSFDLINPVALTSFGSAPYNPFIFVNSDRSREVHLPKHQHTDLALTDLFGKNDDDTDPGKGNFYMSNKYLPWALNIPESFVYPAEKQNITDTYYYFSEWAASMGAKYTDWYLNADSNRDGKKIFIKK